MKTRYLIIVIVYSIGAITSLITKTSAPYWINTLYSLVIVALAFLLYLEEK